MIINKEYKELFKKFDKGKGLCDRCGNDLSNGDFLIHLPFKKTYIIFCGICWNGFTFGLFQDVKNGLRK